jgi:hypothetical protein
MSTPLEQAEALKKMLPPGPIGVWGEWSDADEEDDEWVVGVAYSGLSGDRPVEWHDDEPPGVYSEIAKVRGRAMADALAAVLRAL